MNESKRIKLKKGIDEMRSQLEKDGLHPMFYYGRLDTDGGANVPLVTVCLIDLGASVARGVAVCSDADNPDKIVGKHLSLQRAIKAYHKGACEMVTHQNARLTLSMASDGGIQSKCIVVPRPLLRPIETKILEKR